MNDKDYSDEELEKELDKGFKESETNRNIFRIIKDEKNALDIRAKRASAKFKLKKQKENKN